MNRQYYCQVNLHESTEHYCISAKPRLNCVGQLDDVSQIWARLDYLHEYTKHYYCIGNSAQLNDVGQLADVYTDLGTT